MSKPPKTMLAREGGEDVVPFDVDRLSKDMAGAAPESPNRAGRGAGYESASPRVGVDSMASAKGIKKENWLPSSTLDSTRSCPPNCLTIRATTARPSPEKIGITELPNMSIGFEHTHQPQSRQ